MVGAACWFIWSGVNLGGISRPRALKFVIQRIRSTTVKRDGAAGTLRPTGDQLLQLEFIRNIVVDMAMPSIEEEPSECFASSIDVVPSHFRLPVDSAEALFAVYSIG